MRSCFAIMGFIISIVWTSPGISQRVAIDEAVCLASGFLNSRIGIVKNPHSFSLIEDIEPINGSVAELYYVINYAGGGFALVSADRRFFPVLAYSFSGYFDIGQIPENCRSWLQWYGSQMDSSLQTNGPFFREMPDIWNKYLNAADMPLKISSVTPLVNSAWSQFDPYNLKCPEEPDSYNGHVPVGCVALAMAQLMYYYRFPESGFGSVSYTPSYHGGIYGPQNVDFSASSYDWGEMTDIGFEPDEETAEICYHAGVSLKNAYSPESSGADVSDVPDALRNHFGYRSDDFLSRNDVSGTQEWISLLVGQLDNNQPVLYRSSVGWSGHVYLCDGYQDSTHFHFNWGWGGTYNGYFYIDNLTPGGIQLNYSQGAVFNIYPDTSIYNYPLPGQVHSLLTGISGSFEDGSGPGKYAPDMNRSWLIQPDSGVVTNIMLEFSMLNIEDGKDSIRIYDGPSEESPLLIAFSGNELPAPVESTGPSLLVVFKSDDSVQMDGFHANYYGFHVPFCEGGGLLTDPSGTLEDGSRFMDYRNSTECQWMILPFISPNDSVAGVSLRFDRFELAGGDTVFIYEGMDTNCPLLHQFSEGDSPGTVYAGSSKVLIRFVTDDQLTAGGWKITWDYICPEYCQDSTLYVAPSGILTDGSGDKNYTENTDCHYLIDLSENPFVTVKFLEFNLENNYDFLKFYDADNPYIHLYRFTGPWLPEDVSFSVKRLLIYFHSDERDNKSGWTFSYTASVAGIDEPGNTVSIWPNPAHHELNIESGDPFIGMDYKIYRSDGFLVLFGKLNNAREIISLSSINRGLYILVLENEHHSRPFKFIKN